MGKIVSVVLVIGAVVLLLWVVGYTGVVATDPGAKINARVGGNFKISMESPSLDRVWVLLTETDRVEVVLEGVAGEGMSVWKFKGLRTGNLVLEFAYSEYGRGVHPGDERRAFTVEIR